MVDAIWDILWCKVAKLICTPALCNTKRPQSTEPSFPGTLNASFCRSLVGTESLPVPFHYAAASNYFRLDSQLLLDKNIFVILKISYFIRSSHKTISLNSHCCFKYLSNFISLLNVLVRKNTARKDMAWQRIMKNQWPSRSEFTVHLATLSRPKRPPSLLLSRPDRSSLVSSLMVDGL